MATGNGIARSERAEEVEKNERAKMKHGGKRDEGKREGEKEEPRSEMNETETNANGDVRQVAGRKVKLYAAVAVELTISSKCPPFFLPLSKMSEEERP